MDCAAETLLMAEELGRDPGAKAALVQAFAKYCDICDDPCSQRIRKGLNELHSQLLRSGYTGRKCLRLLKVVCFRDVFDIHALA